MTVVVDHDSGRLVWAAPGRSKETVGRFFDLLKESQMRSTWFVMSPVIIPVVSFRDAGLGETGLRCSQALAGTPAAVRGA